MSTNNGAKENHALNGVKPKHSDNRVELRQLSLIPQSGNQEQSTTSTTRITQPTRNSIHHPSFDSPVILQQSPHWSRAILWGLMGVTTIAVIWACVAKIEEAIPATGKLEPQGTVKEVQAPVAGVVKAIYVDDGRHVKLGERLLALDATTTKSQLVSLQQIRSSLIQENQFEQAQMSGKPSTLLESDVKSKLPFELITLTKNRATLVAENQLFRAELSGDATPVDLSFEQVERRQSHLAELNSRLAAAQAEVEQYRLQLSQTQIKLASTKDTLAMNQGILHNITSLTQSGAISQIQYSSNSRKYATANLKLTN